MLISFRWDMRLFYEDYLDILIYVKVLYRIDELGLGTGMQILLRTLNYTYYRSQIIDT